MKQQTIFRSGAKISKLLIAGFLFSGLTSIAQNPTLILYEVFNATDWENQRREIYTYDANTFLTDMDEQNWINPPGAWDDRFRTDYTNNVDGTMSLGLTEMRNEMTGIWTPYQRVTKTHNGAQQVLMTITEMWDTDWTNATKEIYTYTGGYLTLYEYHYWSTATSSWMINKRHNYVYNGDGTVDYYIEEFYNPDTGLWMNSEKKSNTYTATGKIETITYQLWEFGAWRNDFKESVTYGGDDHILTTLMQNWDLDTNDWSNSVTGSYVTNAAGYPEVVTYLLWTGVSWSNYLRITFTNQSLGLATFSAASHMSLYPNPANEMVTVKTNSGNDNEQFIIFDQLGRQVQKGKLQGNETSIDVSGMKTGTYYLRTPGFKTLKMIKE